MKLNRWMVCALVMALSTAAASPALAEEDGEEEPPPRRFIVHYDQVIPGMTEAYEENAAAWVEAFNGVELEGEWDWHTSVSSDFVYLTVFPFSAFADLDDSDARSMQLKEALGEEKLQQLGVPSHSVDDHFSEIVTHRPDLSYWPEGYSIADSSFMRLGVHTVKPGQGEKFEALMKEVVAAYEKVGHGVGYNAYEIDYGRGTYALTVWSSSAADFYGMPGTGEILMEAVGEEKTGEMYQAWRDTLVDYDTKDWTYRRDLSYEAGEVEIAESGESE